MGKSKLVRAKRTRGGRLLLKKKCMVSCLFLLECMIINNMVSTAFKDFSYIE